MNEVLIKLKKKALPKKWIEETALKILDILEIKEAELSLLITDDSEIRSLNRMYRGKDKATDVLSFPIGEKVGTRFILGDVVISLDTARRQAQEYGHSLEDEVRKLLVHGIIHLLGYDHEAGEKEEKRFRDLEEKVHAKLSGS